MADNTTLQTTLASPPSGLVIATDDVAGVHFQKIKLDIGGDGASVILSNSNPLPISDAGGSITVDGTVNATLTATTYAGMTALTADYDSGAGTQNMPLMGVALPASGGAVAGGTFTNPIRIDPTATTAQPVTDNGGSLTVDGSVAIGSALPAGNNNIGDVDVATVAAGDNVIGRVKLTDGTTVVDVFDYTNANPMAVRLTDTNGDYVTAGAGTEYTEDAASAANPTGSMQMARRRDTLSGTEVSADGDNIAVNATSKGEVYVKHTDAIPVTDNGGSLTVDNGGTFVVQENGAALTALQLIDNIVHAEDAAHVSGNAGVMMLAVRQDSQSGLAADGDYLPPTIDSAGGLRVSIVAGAGSGGTASADDADFTAGTTQGTPAMGIYESTPTLVTDGDLGIAGLTTRRHLKVTLFDTSGSELSVGGGTQYDEDTASADAQKLTMAGVTRADTAASQVGTDGDRSTLIVDASGRLHVNVGNTVTVGAHAVTNAGTFVTQENGAALTALQLIDDAVQVLGTDTYTEATSKGITLGAVRRDADTTLVNTTNEFGPLQMDANGRLKVEAFSGETLPVSLASVPSHAVTNAGTFVTQENGGALTALQLIDNLVLAEDAAHVTADPGVQMLAVRQSSPANLSGANGDYEPLQVNAGRVWASATIDAALPAGTNAIGGVTGTVAHDAAVSGNPFQMAGEARSTDRTAVADADVARIITTLLGKQIYVPYAGPGQTWTYAAASGGITNTTGVTAKAAVASTRNYVTSAQIINGHATVDTDVQIRDGASGTVLWRGFAKAGGGGVSAKFDPPLRGTANTLIEVANGTTGAATYFNLQGFVATE